ncbi:MAG: hypothetical protein ABSC94_01360 [Polyangiaceae bacterium]|jgi:uncharacterized Zn finger protein
MTVDARRRAAARETAKQRKSGLSVQPVVVAGRTIARSFWGKAWCEHLEGYSDYSNRLPRGRSYVRSGSVLHLAVGPGRIDALVQGSALYEVVVRIRPIDRVCWKRIVNGCSGQIDSLVELLQGKLSDGVMRVVTDRDRGLFPEPSQIEMQCSCPDWAEMCKHVAAVLYGVGARLDEQPDLLFLLRHVDHVELLSASPSAAPKRGSTPRAILDRDLAGVFGIEMDTEPRATGRRSSPRAPAPGRAQAVVKVPRSELDGPRMAPDVARAVKRIVALLRRHEEGLSAAQIMTALRLEPKDWARRLAAARSAGKVRTTGQGRTTRYVAT